MQSASALQKRVQHITDEIHDIFHATQLNLQALGVQLQAYNESKITLGNLNHCKEQFDNIKRLFDERGKLRLQYLITQQIKEEEAKVRRERLVEYQEKIYDQRRLIADKEAFYDGLLKPRRRRPAHMTVEQFHSLRRQQIITQERKNLKRLDEQSQELRLMQRTLKCDNDELQKLTHLLEKEELSEQQVIALETALSKNPTMYSNIDNLPNRRQNLEEVKKLTKNITVIQEETSELMKQYTQQKELYQYLKWQYDKLKEEYKSKQNQKWQQEVSRKKRFQKQTKYRLQRSLSM